MSGTMIEDMGSEYMARWATKLAARLDCNQAAIEMAYRSVTERDETPDYGSLTPAQLREVTREARSLRLMSTMIAGDPYAARYEIWERA